MEKLDLASLLSKRKPWIGLISEINSLKSTILLMQNSSRNRRFTKRNTLASATGETKWETRQKNTLQEGVFQQNIYTIYLYTNDFCQNQGSQIQL